MRPTPIDVAEKWTNAALAMWDGTRVSDPLVATLVIRVHAHYGNRTAALSEIVAIAMLEAMNEWQHVREAPVCVKCSNPVLPTQKRDTLESGTAHGTASECR